MSKMKESILYADSMRLSNHSTYSHRWYERVDTINISISIDFSNPISVFSLFFWFYSCNYSYRHQVEFFITATVAAIIFHDKKQNDWWRESFLYKYETKWHMFFLWILNNGYRTCHVKNMSENGWHKFMFIVHVHQM